MSAQLCPRCGLVPGLHRADGSCPMTGRTYRAAQARERAATLAPDWYAVTVDGAEVHRHAGDTRGRAAADLQAAAIARLDRKRGRSRTVRVVAIRLPEGGANR